MKTIASFDIGKLTFSFCIEETSGILDIGKIPKLKYNTDGTCLPSFRPIIDKVCLSGQIIFCETFNLTEGCDNKKKLDPRTLVNLKKVLDDHSSYFNRCDSFIIEQQMSFGKKKSNPMALKISHFLYSYLIIKYDLTKEIVDFPSYHKTKVLGCPKEESKTKYRRKKWSSEICIWLLNERGDEKNLLKILSTGKKDDMADCILQLQAYKFLKSEKKIK